MPIFHLNPSFHDTWIVLDRSLRVVDSGEHLEPLRRKHGSRRTFCFVSDPEPRCEAPGGPPWSLRALLGHAPAALEFAHSRT